MPSSGAGHHRRWWIGGAIGAAVILIIGGVAAGIAIGRTAATAPLILIPSSQPGPNPFTSSTQAAATPTASDAVSKKTAKLRAALPLAKDTRTPVAAGTTPGLYGGTGDRQVCDPQKLVAFLDANRAKATAWAHVLGVAPAAIASYVAGLTPVLLTSDTLVQNHGYRSGSATSFPAILQAGTAVLVDSTGTPRAKCNCGNPLTEPTALSVTSIPATGTRWTGYAPGSVIVVRPGAPGSSGQQTGALLVVDVTNGQVYRQAAGPGASAWVAATGSSSDESGLADRWNISTSSDGVSWNHVALIPNEVVDGIAWGDGRWIAVARPQDTNGPASHSDILTSTDLVSWTVVDSTNGLLRGVGFGAGRWEAVGRPDSSFGNGFSDEAFVYTSVDGTSWSRAVSVPAQGLDGFRSVAYGGGRWLAVTGTGASDAAVAVFASTDGLAWSDTGTSFAGQRDGSIAYGNGSWMIASSTDLPYDVQTNSPAANSVVIDTSADAVRWQTSTPPDLTGRTHYAFAFGGGRWLMATEDSTVPNPYHAFIEPPLSASPDGSHWSVMGRLPGPAGALAYGAPARDSAPPPTSTEGPTPVPSSTPSATTNGTPDCSAAALQQALTAAGLTGTITTDVFCSDEWAAAGVAHTDTKSQTTSVFHWADGSWKVEDRTTVCAQNVLPATLVAAACQSN